MRVPQFRRHLRGGRTVEPLLGPHPLPRALTRLGVKRPHLIHDWRRRHPEFPQPVVELKGTLIWLWPEVEQWAESTGRLT